MDNHEKNNNLIIFRSNSIVFIIIASAIMIMILDSSLTMFCISQRSKIFNISNSDLYLIYAIIFAIINIILLRDLKNFGFKKSKQTNYSYIIIMVNQVLISSMLFSIYGEMRLSSLYHNSLAYALIYSSFLVSIYFLSLVTIKFIRWFSLGRNYLVLIYGLVMLVFIINTVMGLFYLIQISFSHSDVIKPISCRAMLASLLNASPLNFELSNIYDVTAIMSFVLAWLGSVLLLKQYSGRVKKVRYWLLVSLPLIFFIYRYEIALYYLSITEGSDLLKAIRLDPEIFGYQAFEIFINSNLQIGGIFFAITFLFISMKLSESRQLRISLILSGIGIMFLFGSKAIGALIVSSFPPTGIVSISFMSLASYLLYLGIYNSAKLTARDNKLRHDLRNRIENDVSLLKNIASSEKKIESENTVKQLMNFSIQWQKENEQHEMSSEEIREMVHDVISEVKKNKTGS